MRFPVGLLGNNKMKWVTCRKIHAGWVDAPSRLGPWNMIWWTPKHILQELFEVIKYSTHEIELDINWSLQTPAAFTMAFRSETHYFWLFQAMMPLSLPEKSIPAKSMPSKDVQEFKQEVAASRTAVGEKHSDWWQVTNSLVIHVNYIERVCFLKKLVYFSMFTCKTHVMCRKTDAKTVSGLCGDDGCWILSQMMQWRKHSTTSFLKCFELQDRNNYTIIIAIGIYKKTKLIHWFLLCWNGFCQGVVSSM